MARPKVLEDVSDLKIEIADVNQQLNEIVTVELPKKANKEQEDWINATLQNGWTNMVIDAQYYRDTLGVVHLRGLVKKQGATKDDLILRLPVGYRADSVSYAHATRAVSSGKEGTGTIAVLKNGDVLFLHGGSDIVALDGFSFRGEAI